MTSLVIALLLFYYGYAIIVFTQLEGSSDSGRLATSPKGNSMVIGILLFVVAPILGFAVGRMKDINTDAQPPIKAGIVGAGYALLALGSAALVLWVVVCYWCLATGVQSTWINPLDVLFYGLIVLTVGCFTMAIGRLR